MGCGTQGTGHHVRDVEQGVERDVENYDRCRRRTVQGQRRLGQSWAARRKMAWAARMKEDSGSEDKGMSQAARERRQGYVT